MSKGLSPENPDCALVLRVVVMAFMDFRLMLLGTTDLAGLPSSSRFVARERSSDGSPDSAISNCRKLPCSTVSLGLGRDAELGRRNRSRPSFR